jgi:hypothetical protein
MRSPLLYNVNMPRGRPTSDPKTRLLAVRLPERHVMALTEQAKTQGVTLSEALRRCLDSVLASPPSLNKSQLPKREEHLKGKAQFKASPRARRPTPEERATFDQVFAALGLVRRVPRARRSRSSRQASKQL